MLRDLHVTKGVLENGLRLVTIAMPHLHTATVAVFVKTGSRYEDPADNGLSHFVEHMLFRGTQKHDNSFDLNLAFESVGSGLQAETGRDVSVYQTSVEPKNLCRALELFADFLGQPKFDDLELERNLILEERNEDYDENGNEINGADLVRGLLFGNHSLGQRILGTLKTITKFDRDDVRRHFAKHYTSASMVLAVAGPVNHNDVLTLAGRYLQTLPTGSPVVDHRPVTTNPGPSFQYVFESGSQCHVEILWRGVPEEDPLYLAQTALIRAVDDGMASRLHYRLCDQKALAYNLSANIDPLHDVSLVEISGTTASQKVPRLVEESIALMYEFRDRIISDTELSHLQRRFRYEMACLVDDPSAMVSWFGGTSLYYPPQSLAEHSRAFLAVTPKDIQEVARLVLDPKRLAVVVVGSMDDALVKATRTATTAP